MMKFLMFLVKKEMKGFYDNLDFYLCASWSEGTPNPAREAGSCGIPVVTTRVGNMLELIKPGRNGFFIEPTVQSIVSQFRKISQMDKASYRRMSETIRDSVVYDWSWDKRIKNFVSAFDELLSG